MLQHTQQGLCGHSLSCFQKRENYALCQHHRELRTERQKVSRAAAKSPQDSLDVTRPSPSILQAASRTRSLCGASVPWDKVIWVSYPDAKPLDETATLAIQIFPEDRDTLNHDPWLAEACTMELRNTVILQDGGGVLLHQGLVTILACDAPNKLTVDAHTWDWLAQQLPGNLLSSSCKDGKGSPPNQENLLRTQRLVLNI